MPPRPSDDETLAAWELGERRRTRWLAALVIVASLLLVAIVALATLLAARSTVLDKIDTATSEQRCSDALRAAFLGAVGDLIVAERGGDDVAAGRAIAEVERTGALLGTVAGGFSPCELLPTLADP